MRPARLKFGSLQFQKALGSFISQRFGKHTSLCQSSRLSQGAALGRMARDLPSVAARPTPKPR